MVKKGDDFGAAQDKVGCPKLLCLAVRWVPHDESREIERIGGQLTCSGYRSIVRAIPEGHVAREIHFDLGNVGSIVGHRSDVMRFVPEEGEHHG
jgi:hypothetical protein